MIETFDDRLAQELTAQTMLHDLCEERFRANNDKIEDTNPSRVVLTLEDVTTIQRSLHGYLVATDAPNSTWFENRDYLLGTAQSAGWIDGGSARSSRRSCSLCRLAA